MAEPFLHREPDAPDGAPADAPKKVSKLWWVLVVVLSSPPPARHRRVRTAHRREPAPDESGTFDVPGRAEILIEGRAPYRIRYQSNRFTDTGVCRLESRRTGTGENRRTTTEAICGPSSWPSRASPSCARRGETASPGQRRCRRPAHQRRDHGDGAGTFVADEPGTYTVRSDAPSGRSASSWSRTRSSWGLLLVALAVPVGVLAVVLLGGHGGPLGQPEAPPHQAVYATGVAGSPMAARPPPPGWGSGPPPPPPPGTT